MSFEMWSELDILQLYLYSCSPRPEDGHIEWPKHVNKCSKYTSIKSKYICWPFNIIYASN